MKHNRSYIIFLFSTLVVLMAFSCDAMAQFRVVNEEGVRIFPKAAQVNSTAQVITQIQIESLQDLIIDDEDGTVSLIFIDPTENLNASIIRVEGSRDVPIRINFPSSMILFPAERDTEGQITMEYRISWNTTMDQRGSYPLVDMNEELRIGLDGNLYIWVGGYIDISEARVGLYSGDFFVEVEYL